MAQKFFDLVKTAIFYQFLKLRFFHARPSEAETGTSDVNPGYWNRSEVVIIAQADKALCLKPCDVSVTVRAI